MLSGPSVSTHSRACTSPAALMKFASVNEPEAVRAMFEAWDGNGVMHNRELCRIKLPMASLVNDARARGMATLCYRPNTGNIQVMGSHQDLDKAISAVEMLDKCYRHLLVDGDKPKPRVAEGTEGLLETLPVPPVSSYKPPPKGDDYSKAVAEIIKFASTKLQKYPGWDRRFHLFMVRSMGAIFNDVPPCPPDDWDAIDSEFPDDI